MAKKMRTRLGQDGYNYPYTHEDLVFDDNNTLYSKDNYSSFGYIYDATAVQVGSTEGTGRSTASEYRIEIREK